MPLSDYYFLGDHLVLAVTALPFPLDFCPPFPFSLSECFLVRLIKRWEWIDVLCPGVLEDCFFEPILCGVVQGLFLIPESVDQSFLLQEAFAYLADRLR